MISATLKGYWLYRNDAVVMLDWTILLNFGFEKRDIFFNISIFYIKRSMGILEGITSFLLTSTILDG